MAIAALAVWAFTVAAGAYLLTHVIAAKRAEAAPAPATAPAAATASAPATMPTPGMVPAPGMVPTPGTAAASSVFPAIPRTKVTAGPDDHPLREFSHPALALAGLGFWLAFTATHDLAFGWIACGALAATGGIGLSWLVSNARSARQRQARPHDTTSAGEPGGDAQGAGEPGSGEPGATRQGTDEPGTDEPGTGRPAAGEPDHDQQRVPAHLVAVHGLAAATTFLLVVATIVMTAHA